ncbi:MAG TPA: aldo/keto reductase [Candidatus Enterenecus stercoripullorum]|nr:aldo/keto reductase [Candidatus Enterenecus stercoripullorum]
MEYRINRRTGDKISVIGLGTSSIAGAGTQEGIAALQLAFEQGVNYFDLATAESDTFPLFRAALSPVRDRVFYQIHFGAVYADGKSYSWTTGLDAIRRSVDWQLKALGTDYIDYGFIHCLDESDDWVQYQKNGALDYLLQLRDQGVVRHIGLSSHTPATIQQVLDTGLVDMLMFSINPAYDYQHGEFANGSGAERMALYRRCQTQGIGISVMKTFSGGQLLDEKTSPFGVALSEYQCIQYALDKPGVLTVLPGVRSREDVRRILGYLDASPQARDYSVISTLTPADMEGTCVYCNHCQPCPAGLDIGLINKYYDLTLAGDSLAADHYHGLSVHADACIACGHCNRRCPFHVDQVSRMGEIARYFAG